MMVRSRAEERKRELKLFQVPLGVPTTPYSGPAGADGAWRRAAPYLTAWSATQEQRPAAGRALTTHRAGPAFVGTHACPATQHDLQQGAPGRFAAALVSRQVLSAEQVEAFR